MTILSIVLCLLMFVNFNNLAVSLASLVNAMLYFFSYGLTAKLPAANIFNGVAWFIIALIQFVIFCVR